MTLALKSDAFHQRIGCLRAGDPDFEGAWQRFLTENGHAGPFYSPLFIEFLLQRGKNRNSRNCSFVLLFDEKPAVIVPLIAEDSKSGKTFLSSNLGFNSLYGPLVAADCSERIRKFLQIEAFDRIDAVAGREGAVKAYMAIDPYTFFNESEYYNYLPEFGYLDASMTTNVVDLRQDIEAIKRKRRRHYKPLINKGLRKLEFRILNDRNIERESFFDYVEQHRRKGKTASRSSATYELQLEMVNTGQATLIAALSKNDVCALNFYQHLNGYVFYSSSVRSEGMGEFDDFASHALLWFSIEYFRKVGFKVFETGYQYYSPQIFDLCGEKDMRISFFKRGFGGQNIALYRGIKYYGLDVLEDDLRRFVAHMESEPGSR